MRRHAYRAATRGFIAASLVAVLGAASGAAWPMGGPSVPLPASTPAPVPAATPHSANGAARSAVTAQPGTGAPRIAAAAPPGTGAARIAAAAPHGKIVGPVHTVGGQLVDAAGHQVQLTGVNWFGFETQTFAPHGLWARSWQSMLDQMVGLGFNTIRLPYSNQLFKPNSMPNGIDYAKNPDLKGLTGLQLMDKIVQGAGDRGLKVILDQHRPDSNAQSPLWYTGDLSDQQWIDDWTMLARHYRGNSTVIGGDLHNEPNGQVTWGDGNVKTDWRLAAERAGNAILAVNSQWLIVVEGTDHYQNDYYWWGGNLAGALKYPVQLSVPGRLVYSAHDYGPGVYNQPWFQAKDFPNNLAGIWDSHWGYLQRQGIAPVLMGEFGGRSMGQDTEGKWQRTLVDYLKTHGISYTYWSWNANSGDTGGILNDDWTTVNKSKVDVLSAYQWPPAVRK